MAKAAGGRMVRLSVTPRWRAAVAEEQRRAEGEAVLLANGWERDWSPEVAEGAARYRHPGLSSFPSFLFDDAMALQRWRDGG
jgi:hypothetical protein